MVSDPSVSYRVVEDRDEVLALLAYRPPVPDGRGDPDLAPLRLRHAWRIARERVRLAGWTFEGGSLSELFEKAYLDELDSAPEDLYWKRVPMLSRADTEEDLVSTSVSEVDLRYLAPSALRRRLEKLPILPPADDKRIEEWRAAVEVLAERFFLRDSPRAEDPNSGDLMPQADDGSCAQALDELLGLPNSWPSAQEIIDAERSYEDLTLSLVIQRGRQKTANFLRLCLGLTPREATTLVALARQRAEELTGGSIDEKRAAIELALEDLASRARKALDMRVELGTLKALAVVQGVARAEVEDDNGIFVRVARQAAAVAKEPQKTLLVAGSSTPTPTTDGS